MAATRTLVPSGVPSFRLPAAAAAATGVPSFRTPAAATGVPSFRLPAAGGVPSFRTPAALTAGPPAPRALPASAAPARSGVPSFRVPTGGGAAPAEAYTFGGGHAGAASHPGGLAGLVSNATQIVTGFPSGIAHFVGDVLKTAVAPAHVALDVATGNFTPSFDKYVPAITGVVKSFGHTAGDIINPTHFIKAYQHGDLLSKILEDAGNAALVFGAAGKAIGAGAATSAMTASDAEMLNAIGKPVSLATPGEITKAGLPPIETTVPEGPLGNLAQAGTEPQAYYTGYRGFAGRAARAGDLERAAQLNQLGNQVRRYATLGAKVGNAPAEIYTKPLNYALGKAGVEGGLAGVAGKITAQLPENFGKWRYSAQGVGTREAGATASAAETRLKSQALEPGIMAREMGLTTSEQRVAMMGTFLPKAQLSQYGQIGESALADVLNQHFQDFTEGTRPTVRDARLAAQWANGELGVEATKNIELVQNKIADFAKGRQERWLAAGGDPSQTGSSILPGAVKARTDELQFQRDKLTKLLDPLQERADRHGETLATHQALVAGVPEPPTSVVEQGGRLKERYAKAVNSVNSVQRRIGTIDERIKNVETDLTQRFQDVYHTKVNLPSVTRLTNAMFTGTSRLGTLLRKAGRRDLATAFEDGSLAGDQVIHQLEASGHTLTDTQRAQLEHSIAAEGAASQIVDHMENLKGDTTGQRLVAPVDVKNIIDRAGLPDHTTPAVDAAYDNYLQRRANVTRTVLNDQTGAMPKRFRTAGMWAQRHVGALIEQGIKENRDVPGSGDQFLQQAEETATTLKKMVDAGFDPAHLVGGKEVTPGQAAAKNFTDNRLTQPSLRSGFTSIHGIQQLDPAAYGRLESQQAEKWVVGQRNAHLDANFGKEVGSFPQVQAELATWADKHPGEVMPPLELRKVVSSGLTDEHSVEYRPIDPAANVTPESRVVPKKIFDQFQKPAEMGPAMRAVKKGNSAFKTWVLPFSGKWQTGNAIGNVLQASMHAGVNPIELGRIAHGLIREQGGFRALWKNEGLAPGLPRTLTESGLTHGEMESLFGRETTEPRTPIGKFARGSYKFNSTVDNLTRSSVYMAKLAEGQGSEMAMRTTMRALGDYTKLNPTERNTVRQIFPFYTWLKHSVTATLRLPITSPTRAAFFANLQNIYQDDPKLQGIVGQGMRIGNTGVLDFGTGNPLADFGSDKTMFNPMNWGAAVSPSLKIPAALALGIDVQKMARLTRPPSTGQGTGNISPLSQLFHNPAGGLGEIAWQLTQQGPTQVRALRDYVLGDQTRYGGTGYRSGFTDPNRRNPWQAARILSLPNVRYDPRLTKGS